MHTVNPTALLLAHSPVHSVHVFLCGYLVQLARYSTEGLLQLGPLGSTTFLPDTKCLVDDGRGRTPRLKKCEAVSRTSQRLWDFTQVVCTPVHLQAEASTSDWRRRG